MLSDTGSQLDLQTCSASEYPSAAGPEDGVDCLPAGREQLRV